MNARELIHQVEELGITLRVAGDKLRVKAQVGIITPAIKAELTSHKAEILEVLREPANQPPVTRVYHVIIETNGVHKGMTIIDPSGDDLEGFRQSCCNRFGAERVVSIEPQQRRQE